MLLKEEKRLKNGFKNTYYKVLKFKCDHCGNQFEYVKSKISERLELKYKNRFKIILVPNITNICYGRGVGYKIEEIILPEKIQKISATKIRKKMRKKGLLK